MAEAFDPYHRWLGIRDSQRPPNHYRLLGLDLYESDPEIIASAADRQMSHVRTFSTGPHSELSQHLLNEIARAKMCLLDPQLRANYDAQLSQPEPLPPSHWQNTNPPPAMFSQGWQAPSTAQALKQANASKPKYGHFLLAAWMGLVVLAVVGLALLQLNFTPEPPPKPPKQAEDTTQVDDRGRLVVASSGKAMTKRATVQGHKTSMSDFAMFPQSQRLLSIGLDRKIQLWQLPALPDPKQLIESDQMLRLVAVSAETDRFVVCDYAGGGFIASAESPEEQTRLEGDTKQVRCLAMTANGAQVIAGLDSGSILVWDGSSGQKMFEFSAHQAAVNQILALPDQQLLSAGQDTRIYLSNLATRRPTQTFLGHGHSVTALSVNPSLTRMVSGDASGTLIWWEYPARKVARMFDAHRGEVTAVQVTRDGLRALSGGEDEALHFWQLNTAEHLLSAPKVHVGRIGRIVLSAQEDLAYSSDTTASMHIWEISDVESSPTLAPPPVAP